MHSLGQRTCSIMEREPRMERVARTALSLAIALQWRRFLIDYAAHRVLDLKILGIEQRWQLKCVGLQ